MDEADLAQAQQEALSNFAALAASRKVAKKGLETCPECGEPISPLRQALGAQLCVDCQTLEEQRIKRGLKYD